MRVHSLELREWGAQIETLSCLAFNGETKLEIDIWQLAENRWHLKLEWTQMEEVAHCAVRCFRKRIWVPLDGARNPWFSTLDITLLLYHLSCFTPTQCLWFPIRVGVLALDGSVMHVLGLELILSKCLANEWSLMQKIESTQQMLKESQLLGVHWKIRKRGRKQSQKKACPKMDFSLPGWPRERKTGLLIQVTQRRGIEKGS